MGIPSLRFVSAEKVVTQFSFHEKSDDEDDYVDDHHTHDHHHCHHHHHHGDDEDHACVMKVATSENARPAWAANWSCHKGAAAEIFSEHL